MLQLRETLSREKQRQRVRRRIVEQQLHHSEQRLRDITNAIPGIVFEYVVRSDRQQGFTYISDGSLDIYGLSPEHIIEDPNRLWALVPLSEIQRVREAFRETLLKHKPLRLDHRIWFPEDDLRWLRIRGDANLDAEGNTILRGIILDITAQKQAEEAQRISEEGFRKMFEEHSSIMLLIDPPTGLLLDANPAASQFYGYTRDELKQRKVSDLNTLRPEQVHGHLQEATAKGRRFFQFPHRLANGEVRLVEVHTSVIRTLQGEMLFSIIHDATERITAQRELAEEREHLALRIEERTAALRLANEKLQQSAKLKDEFLANISHELRTPLNAVLSMSEILLERIFGELNEKQASYLRVIQQSGRHLLALINDLLDLSRMEQKQFHLELKRFDVYELCVSSIEMIQQIAHNKEQEIVFTCELPPKQRMLEADELRIRQILVNLLSNAVKFTPKGRKIGLQIEGAPPYKTVKFTVWDEGVGIPPHEQQRLFQPFTQLQSGLDRPHEGSGLGLYLVQRLAELHKGQVILESEGIPGQGTRFHIILPMSQERPQQNKSNDKIATLSSSHQVPTYTQARPHKTKQSATLQKQLTAQESPPPTEDKGPTEASIGFLLTQPHKKHKPLLEAFQKQQMTLMIAPPNDRLFYLAQASPPHFLLLESAELPKIPQHFFEDINQDLFLRTCCLLLLHHPQAPQPNLPKLERIHVHQMEIPAPLDQLSPEQQEELAQKLQEKRSEMLQRQTSRR
ncbi:MAG: PAS domain S-box protein [Myxococcales bacterium]|nr:PAS domain S-box protein [Myxococcales bacterium]